MNLITDNLLVIFLCKELLFFKFCSSREAILINIVIECKENYCIFNSFFCFLLPLFLTKILQTFSIISVSFKFLLLANALYTSRKSLKEVSTFSSLFFYNASFFWISVIHLIWLLTSLFFRNLFIFAANMNCRYHNGNDTVGLNSNYTGFERK